MTIKIRPNLDPSFDYQGTLFSDIEITIFEDRQGAADDDFGKMMDSAFGVLPSQAAIPPTVMKTYWLSDRRYKPFHHNWTLDQLVGQLDLALSFGPVGKKLVEQHPSFIVERERPEDRLLKVSTLGVCLNEWPFQPIYRLDNFSSLQPAVAALKDIQTYIRNQRD